jgi:PAS domain S-box-containing protein
MENFLELNAHNFIDSEIDLLCVFKNGKFSYFSPAWINLLGWTQEELLVISLEDLLHPDDLGLSPFTPDSQPTRIENRFVTKNREVKWLKWRTHVDPKNAQEIFAVATDLTELKLKDRALKASQDQALLGTWSYQKDCDKYYWSEKIYDIYEIPYGTPLSYVKEKKFHDHENWKKITEAFFLCLNHGKRTEIEVKLTTQNGQERNCWH